MKSLIDVWKFSKSYWQMEEIALILKVYLSLLV